MNKTPLGLRPRYIVDFERLIEITDTIQRYLYADKPIPQDWLDEFIEINRRLREKEENKALFGECMHNFKQND